MKQSAHSTAQPVGAPASRNINTEHYEQIYLRSESELVQKEYAIKAKLWYTMNLFLREARDQTMELTKIKIWPGWTATRLIGEGSFGKVYEIVRNNFGIEEHSALKIITIPSSQAELQSLKNDGMDEESATEFYRGLVNEFVQEIALMSKLKGNPNIVNYEDYAVIEHNVSVGWDILIRMELLTDLPSYIRVHSLSTKDVIKLGIDICNALEACQAQKIIHRDIKPDNIFISSSGEYKLGDFGVARTIEKTVSGLSKKGTYTYMAPEVYRGEDYGTTADIYSLGIVMYKLLNFNREPFLPPHPQPIKYSDKNNALVRRISGEFIPAPANADELFSKIVLKACAHRPSERYQSASEMKKELVALLNKVKAHQPALLQTDQVVSFKTNSGTIHPVISTPDSENAADAAHIEETLQVIPQAAVEARDETERPAQKTSQPNQTPKVYVFGGQPDVSVYQQQQQYKTLQSAANNQQQKSPQPAPNNRQQKAPQVIPNDQQYRVVNTTQNSKRTTGMILGWTGVGLAVVLMFIFAPYLSIQTVGIIVTQILYSMKKDSKVAAILMMVCSILSVAILNFIVSLNYLKLCNNKEAQR